MRMERTGQHAPHSIRTTALHLPAATLILPRQPALPCPPPPRRSITDLVALNPGASALQPGAKLKPPCYPGGKATEFDYYGGSAAFGHFSGGNQQAGPDEAPTAQSLPGAMAAARVNGGLPNQ